MARTNSEADRQFIRRLKRFLPLSALIACPASAAQLQVATSLTVDQTYTDNVALAPSGQERSEWVTQLRPQVTVTFNGPKLKFDASYTADFLYYASTGETSLRHQFSGGSGGDSKTTWELVPELLYLDASAGLSQRTTSVLGPQAQSNVNTTGNRATVFTAVASPHIRYAFGDEAVGTARYTYSLVGSGAGGGALADSGANRFDARIESGPTYRRTRWHVAYNREVVAYSDSTTGDTTFEQVTAGVQQLIASNIALTGTVGYDRNDYGTISGETPRGASWNVGVNWTPTPRTNFAASYGKRYFGNTYSLDFSHRMRTLVLNATYSEAITTTRGLLTQPVSASTATTLDTLFLARIPDPIARQQAVQTFITTNSLPSNLIVPVDFFTNQVFLSKTFRAGIGLQGVRHTVLTEIFTTTRETEQSAVSAIGPGDFALSSTVKQTGVSGTWSWRITPEDSTNFTLGYTRNEFPSIAREDDVTYFYWTYSHQFGRKLSGALNYRRLNSESNLGGAGSYTENAAIASLRMTF